MGQARLRLRRQQGWQRERLWPRLEGQCKTQRVLQRVQREGQVLQQRKLLRRQARLQVQWCPPHPACLIPLIPSPPAELAFFPPI